MAWILGNGSRAQWHLAEERSYTHDARQKYLVAACNGRQLGGAWGPRMVQNMPSEVEHAHCAKCAALHRERTAGGAA